MACMRRAQARNLRLRSCFLGLALRNKRVRAGQAKNPTGYGAFLSPLALLKCQVLVKAAPKRRSRVFKPHVRNLARFKPRALAVCKTLASKGRPLGITAARLLPQTGLLATSVGPWGS
jgi:hypothetical protein